MSSELAATTSEAECGVRASACSEVLVLEFFRCCFDEFPDPVIVTDAQDSIVFLNHAAQILTGHAVTEQIEKKVQTILPGSDVTVHVEPAEMAER